MRYYAWAMITAFSLMPLTGLPQGAGTVTKGQMFVEKKGVNEFSGEMIARPRQPHALKQAGLNEDQSNAVRSKALVAMGIQIIRHYPEVDEYVVRVPIGLDENTYAKQLMATGSFEYVEPNWTLYPVITPNDPSYGSQWHLPKINAPIAWNHFTGDGSVTVAITDTGVRTAHQDLSSRLVPGANSASGTAVPQTSGGQVEDINGHGTHCAGIAAAAGNNGLGVSGIGWNTKIMPIRVTNSTGGSASLTALTAGARWAADNGARVVSTSYSGFSSSSVQTTGNYIKVTRNGVYCWAAGNDNVNRSTDHIDVTVVGASTESDGKASFSAYGSAIDVFSPGTNIYSTYFNSNTSYAFASGTSMACPLTAGTAALITGTNLSMTAQQIETLLYTTCLDLTAAPGGVGNDNYWGWGRIDAAAAVRAAYNTYAFRPTAFTAVIGSLLSGTLTDLGTSNNVRTTFQRDLEGAYEPLVVTFDALSTNNSISRIDLQIENSVSKPYIAQVTELYDFQSGQWVAVDERMAPLSETAMTISVTASPQRFRSAGTGTVRARMIYFDIRNDDRVSWSVSFDRLNFLTAAS